jgi:DNA-binding Lrp family transcriptional regulator
MNDLNYYSIIPSYILLSQELTDSEKILCGLISGLSTKEGYCYASNEIIAKYVGKTTNAVQATIKRLYAKNIIENIGTKLDRQLRLKYIATFEQNSEDTKSQIDSSKSQIDFSNIKNEDTKSQIDSSKSQIDFSNIKNEDTKSQIDSSKSQIDFSTLLYINNNKNNVQGHVQKNLDDTFSFEDWYKIYPRKEKKDRALKAFNKLTKYHKSFLLQATQMHIEHKESLNEIFEHPATFLNSKVFLDYEKKIKEKTQKLKTNEGAKNVLSILINKINATLKLDVDFEKFDYRKLKTNEGAEFFNEFELSVLDEAQFSFEVIKEFDEDEVREYLQNYIGEMI